MTSLIEEDQGREVVKEPEVTVQVIDLMEALKRSVEKQSAKNRLPHPGQAAKAEEGIRRE